MTAPAQQGPATPAGPPATPELEKQAAALKDGAHRVGEFLDWLSECGYVLAKYGDDGQLHPTHVQPIALVAGFYGVDLDKIEQERRALLDFLRVVQQ